MLKIKIICVGKIGEKYLAEGIKEYKKRLSKYINLELIEVKDEPLPKKNNDKEIDKIKHIEGEKIKGKLDSNSHIIMLDLEGKQFTSEEFAKKIKEFENTGINKINIIIGGTMGLSDGLKRKADTLISFSKMTFPHQLMRLILLEQIFRAFKINKNEPYHT
ncbi:23S rRNA (pseudouridine(1915)-N(3))-methyltransferase RlmH [Natranaerofaba carboxydovora]|uniref:23S rRNA (pseudouridine(1915)-N(3))-methyltransferase RlmH n=1 Tax=Natranaerofaba carboxydovora TaxID=2742683 RepID=UPI001F1432A7|nr:23S rRNA (pseudouridine(1915)-N(3))-methyltransferase RlmH [Natranaerofaba carboxydovora]UMZ75148.1 Ribosomal RNA large subunit methyltransferase H [Natranaerofaba carboxydovora]